jgi:hypothetical protein
MIKFWVGGTGTWTDTAHWSDTSGGTGGAALPATTDTAVFDANSATAGFTVTLPSTSFSTGSIDASACPYSDCVLTWPNTSSRNSLTFNGSLLMPVNFELRMPAGAAGSIILAGPSSGTPGVCSVANCTANQLRFNGLVRMDAPLQISNALNPSSVSAVTVTGGVLDTNGQNITTSSVDLAITANVSCLAGATLNHNGGTIRTGRLTIGGGIYNTSGGVVECTVDSATTGFDAVVMSAGQYIEDLRLIGTGHQKIRGPGSFGFLTRWLPDGGASPTLSFDTQSGVAPNFSVLKRLTVVGTPAARIKVEGLGGVASVDAHLASFNDCDVQSIAITGHSSPAMVCGGSDLGSTSGFAFPPAALFPLFAAGLA